MDSKRLMTGTLVGGITMFALGYLIFVVIMGDFYTAHTPAAEALRDDPMLWPDILGTFSLAALVTLCIGWSGASSMASAFKIGATVGFLVWFGVDFIFYGFTNMSTLTRTIIDPFLEIIRTGLGGAVIGMVLAKTSGE